MRAQSQNPLQERLSGGLASLSLSLTEQQQKQLLDYLALMTKWNKVYNLTAITGEGEMLTHHLLDSLAVVKPLQKHLAAQAIRQARVLDVGAGAGLPGAVIAICCPEYQVVCVDAVGKKASFINQVAAALSLKNLNGVHTRVEALQAGIVGAGFDVVTSRAFASLSDFVGLTAALLRLTTGVWMAMKAKTVEAEAANLPEGTSVFHVEQLEVPDLNEERRLVWLRLH